ncbi:hypothetical protein PG999_012976 [Apiospora kogelbergensis]|uniref:Uncharacterized protein n=1 Tax=Apiospora kogelbergensis TaxID=1337665 RepID=A0AAW0Q9T3_9PEZI
MAPIIKYAFFAFAALAGVTLADRIGDPPLGNDEVDWHMLDAAGPAKGFELNAAVEPSVNYTTPISLLNATIRAPLDCKSQDTYLGQQVFTDGPLSFARCADVCTAQREYDAKSYGGKRPCRFFNTYTLVKAAAPAEKGGPLVTTPVGQVCSLYSETWPATFSTDRGQWRGNELYLITDSFAGSYIANSSSGQCDAKNPHAAVGAPAVTTAPTSSGVTTKTVTTTTTATTSKAT